MKKMTRRDFLKGMTASSLGIAAMGIVDSNMIVPAAAEAAAGWDGTYMPGLYTSTVAGRMGDITVEVEFSQHAIERVAVLRHSETEAIASAALKNIPEMIVDTQTLNLDTVSGATVTSDAILNAVADCVKQAGGDPEMLKQIPEITYARSMKPGTYTASSHGHHSDVVVEVMAGNSMIESVKVISSGETFNLADAAIDVIPARIVETQSIGIDAVSGATYTSRAILSAVEDCLIQAGGKENARAFNVKVEEEPWSTQEHTIETDVVVVGSGMAGIAAALSAQEKGAKVAIVEKLPFWGGISQTCKGYFRLPFDGTDASAESYYQYGLHMYCGTMKGETMDDEYPNKELLHTLAYNSYAAGKWMEEKGAELNWLPLAQIQNQPEYYLGGCHFISEEAVAPDVTGINFKKMLEYFTANGGEIYLDTPAESVIVAEDGSVVGLKAVGKYGIYTFKAKSVVLCAGGFGANPEMIKEFAPSYQGEENVTLVSNVGDGIRMAIEAGGVPYDNGLMMGQFGHSMVTDYDMVHPYEDNETPSAAVFVNPQGLRVNSETPVAYSGGTAYVNPDAQDYYWAITNQDIASQSDYIHMLNEQLESGNERFFKADTLAELAKKIRITPNTLRYTLNRYNKLCEEGVDTDFCKKAQYLIAMNDGPWYAVKCFVKYFGTVGGVKINTESAVLDKNGNPIPGLYAAGENANHGFFNLSYVGGRSMPVCLTMGRIAGASAAAHAL